jgi:hypothetical protein
MINILLSLALFITFKAAFLQLFASQRTHRRHSSAAQIDQLPGGIRRVLNESQANAP